MSDDLAAVRAEWLAVYSENDGLVSRGIAKANWATAHADWLLGEVERLERDLAQARRMLTGHPACETFLACGCEHSADEHCAYCLHPRQMHSPEERALAAPEGER